MTSARRYHRENTLVIFICIIESELFIWQSSLVFIHVSNRGSITSILRWTSSTYFGRIMLFRPLVSLQIIWSALSLSTDDTWFFGIQLLNDYLINFLEMRNDVAKNITIPWQVLSFFDRSGNKPPARCFGRNGSIDNIYLLTKAAKLNGILTAFRFILSKTIVWIGFPARL
jgi:hypothetical protein